MFSNNMAASGHARDLARAHGAYTNESTIVAKIPVIGIIIVFPVQWGQMVSRYLSLRAGRGQWLLGGRHLGARGPDHEAGWRWRQQR
jgi:hypothetical protein